MRQTSQWKSEVNGSSTNTLSLFAVTRSECYVASIWKKSNEFVKKWYHDKNVVMITPLPADQNPYKIWDFKIAKSDWSQNFMKTAKTMDLTGICFSII